MTNTVLLKEAIASKGLKMNFIARALNISRSCLWKKINNQSPFNQYEIDAMSKLLSIKSYKERDAIFFAEKVD